MVSYAVPMASRNTNEKRDNTNGNPGLSRTCGAVCLVVAAAAVFAAFSPSLDNGFTNYDDDDFIVNNRLIREISWDSLREGFSCCLEDAQGPLTLLSLAVDYQISLEVSGPEGAPDAGVYHATSLLCHLLCVFLVYLLLRTMGAARLGSLFGALLFGLHPLRVESVAWASQRKDVLCAFFFIMAMLLYQRYLTTLSLKRLGLCLAVFVLALASKPMAVSFPVVLLLQDFLARRQLSKRLFVEKIPFFLLAAGVAAATLMEQSRSLPAAGALDAFSNVLIGVRGLAFYLLKTVCPFGLSAFYPYPPEISLLEPVFLGSTLFVAACALAVYWFRKRSRTVVFCALFFLVTLLPVLKIVPVADIAAADRYTYIPSLAISLAAALLLERLIERLGRKEIAAAGLIALLGTAPALLGLAAFDRVKVWKDSISLWENVLLHYPDAAKAHYNLGLAYRVSGNNEKAIEQYSRTIDLDPRHAGAYNNIAFIKRIEGDFVTAETFCRKAIDLDPEMWEAHLNLACILIWNESGRFEEALTAACRSLDLNPTSDFAWFARGLALFYLDRRDEAVRSLDHAVSLDPKWKGDVNRVKSMMEQ